MEGVSDSKYFTTADPPACSCPGWYWRRRCRHVDELRVALALIASNRAKWVERGGQPVPTVEIQTTLTGMSSMAWLSTGGGEPIRQTQLPPDGLEFCADVSRGLCVEESSYCPGRLRPRNANKAPITSSAAPSA